MKRISLLRISQKKTLYVFQKAIKFFEELIELFTTKGEWILDGFGGIGDCMMHEQNNFNV